MKNYLVYPCKSMKITQNHTDGNHYKHTNGRPADYPFDEAGVNSGRDWFYCPCDEMKIVKIYTAGVNTVWMESTKPVVMPIGTANVTIMVEHMNDDDMKLLSVGRIYRRGEKMFREGKDGATGNHFHISIALGKTKGGGWKKNSNGAWVLTTDDIAVKADEALFLDGTSFIKSAGYKFINKPKEEKPVAKMDNNPDKYAVKAVEWAKKEGILKGDDDGNLRLHDPITRQDVVVMLYRENGGK